MPDPQKARFPMDVIFFCADCNRDFGRARNDSLGYYLICPNARVGQSHLARVILNQAPAKAWLRRERQFLSFQTKVSPFMVLRRIFPQMQAGAYICVSTAFLCLAILSWGFLLASGLPYLFAGLLKVVLIGLVVWRFVDIVVTNVSITFTSRFPANPVRSVFYSLAAYVQIALSFAFFYLVLGSAHFKEEVSPASTVFFSFGTIATVGYGNLVPTTPWAQFLVSSELVLGLFFVAIIIAQVAGWASTSRREEGEYPVEDLR